MDKKEWEQELKEIKELSRRFAVMPRVFEMYIKVWSRKFDA